MKGIHPLWGLIIFILLIVINNILYGYIAALASVNESDLEEADDKYNDRKEKLLGIIDKPAKFINTLQIIAAIIDFFVGAFLLGVFVNCLQRYNIVEGKILATIITVVVLLIFLIVLGILAPQKIAVNEPARYLLKVYGIVVFFVAIFSPITWITTLLANCVVRLFGIDPNADVDNVTEEEIITMVNEGHEQGVLLESEAKMINNIFEFADKTAGDVMVHRSNILAIDGNTTLEKTVEIILDAGVSRLPIYEENIDNIIGIIHFKDAFKEYENVAKRKLTIIAFKDIFIDAHFIPETRSISDLFKEMQVTKNHMSIVVDEYGQTAGLVTMEDIIEEIVGNIFDEHDEDDTSISKQSENVYVVEGLTHLDELEELLSIEFDEKEFETLNGFLISKLKRIPEDNETFEINYKGYSFKVLETEKNMIKKVRIIKNDKDIQSE